MNVDDRTERLRVLLDPWCDHAESAWDGMDTADVFTAVACVEARRDAYDAAWDALAIVLAAMARHDAPTPEVAITKATRDDDLPTLARFLLAALDIGWAEPFDQRRNDR